MYVMYVYVCMHVHVPRTRPFQTIVLALVLKTLHHVGTANFRCPRCTCRPELESACVLTVSRACCELHEWCHCASLPSLPQRVCLCLSLSADRAFRPPEVHRGCYSRHWRVGRPAKTVRKPKERPDGDAEREEAAMCTSSHCQSSDGPSRFAATTHEGQARNTLKVRWAGRRVLCFLFGQEDYSLRLTKSLPVMSCFGCCRVQKKTRSEFGFFFFRLRFDSLGHCEQRVSTCH